MKSPKKMKIFKEKVKTCEQAVTSDKCIKDASIKDHQQSAKAKFEDKQDNQVLKTVLEIMEGK